MTSNDALLAYLNERRTRIEDALRRYLPGPPTCPAVLVEAIRYSLHAGGKRLRPILTLAAAEAVTRAGPPDARLHPDRATELALPAACAIEMIHTYSLIHDDLPAMDDDTMRRGRPTLHIAHGEGMAILAGDGLLTEAFGLLAREPQPPPGAAADPLAERKLRAIRRVAEAAGTVGMVGGQAIDLDAAARGRTAAFSTDMLRTMHSMKTGALIRAAAAVGAIMVGGTDAHIQALDRYASELGLAFQIVDDLLDVEGTTTVMGKTAGKDAAARKPTYVSFFGIDESRRLARECVARARAALEDAGLRDERLAGIARWVLDRHG